MKIDILGGTWSKCECGDNFATNFAMDLGIMVEPLCFSCILNLLISEKREAGIED
jgi:hypothetical protein